jgi:preprotein translocase subunit SecG
MVRLDNLLFISSGLPTPSAGKNVEVRHWFTQWEQEWTGINRTINYLKMAYPSIMNKSDDKTNKILLASAADKNSEQRSISSLIGLMDSPENSLQALQIRKERESRRLGIIVTENRVLPSLIESNPVVLCRNTMTKSGASLFGAVKGGVNEIRLTTNSDSNRIADKNFLTWRTIIFVGAFAIIILIFRRYKLLNLRKKLDLFTTKNPDDGGIEKTDSSTFMSLFCRVLQHVVRIRYLYFWLLIFGCLTIIFFPDGIISVAIIVTILLSRLRTKTQRNDNQL